MMNTSASDCNIDQDNMTNVCDFTCATEGLAKY